VSISIRLVLVLLVLVFLVTYAERRRLCFYLCLFVCLPLRLYMLLVTSAFSDVYVWLLVGHDR